MSEEKDKSKERATETLRDLVVIWLEESEFLSDYRLVPLSLLKELEHCMGKPWARFCPICKRPKYGVLAGHSPTCPIGKLIGGS